MDSEQMNLELLARATESATPPTPPPSFQAGLEKN